MSGTTSIKSDKIFDAVVDSISSITRINKKNINEDTDLNKLDPSIDSLSRIEILMEVEKKVIELSGLKKFNLEEAILEKGSTVRHFTEEIKNKLNSEGIEVETSNTDEV